MAASQDFNGSTQRLYRTASSPKDDIAIPCALTCWFNADVVSGGSKYIMCVWGFGNYIGIRINSGNLTIASRANSGTTYTHICGAINNSQWYHCVINFASATERTCFLDGAQFGTSDTNSSDPTAFTMDAVEIGSLNTAVYYDGKVAYPAIYNKELNLAEINEIRFKPYTVTDSLIWAPNMLIDGSAVGDYYDLSGNGYDPDNGVIPTASLDGPPVQFY